MSNTAMVRMLLVPFVALALLSGTALDGTASDDLPTATCMPACFYSEQYDKEGDWGTVHTLPILVSKSLGPSERPIPGDPADICNVVVQYRRLVCEDETNGKRTVVTKLESIDVTCPTDVAEFSAEERPWFNVRAILHRILAIDDPLELIEDPGVEQNVALVIPQCWRNYICIIPGTSTWVRRKTYRCQASSCCTEYLAYTPNECQRFTLIGSESDRLRCYQGWTTDPPEIVMKDAFIADCLLYGNEDRASGCESECFKYDPDDLP